MAWKSYSVPGFPIRVQTENHYLFIDSFWRIWWTTGSVTTMLGEWLGNPFEWGLIMAKAEQQRSTR